VILLVVGFEPLQGDIMGEDLMLDQFHVTFRFLCRIVESIMEVQLFQLLSQPRPKGEIIMWPKRLRSPHQDSNLLEINHRI